MRPPAHSTTKLPGTLLDELGEPGQSSGGRKRYGNASSRTGPRGRKERRKIEREQKKGQRRHSKAQQSAREPRHEELSSSEEADPKPVVAQPPKPLRDTSQVTREGTEPLRSILKKSTNKSQPLPVRKPSESPDPSPQLSKGVRDKLAADDQEIADLEKKLGIKGRKKLPQSFEEDGLGSLMDGLDGDAQDDPTNGRKRKRTEEEDWLEQKRKRAQHLQDKQREELDSGDSAYDDLLDESDDDDNGSESGHYPGASEDDFEGFDSEEATTVPPPKKRENPYIAPPTTTNVEPAAKYIPPSLRKASDSETESLSRLRRQLQGLLNRLSEANMLTLLKELEEIYRQSPRQHVTTTLIDLLLGLICDRSGLTETFLILHGGFIAAIYKVVGMDFGALALQRIVEEFDRFYAQLQATHNDEKTIGIPDSKEASNLTSLLAVLYNLQVVGSLLMFDLIRLLLSSLSETNTELLLRIIKNCGSQLRQDDPSALKDIVIMLQTEVAQKGEGNLSVRTKFMIETINNLKNNRMKTGAAASAMNNEANIRMKKLLGSLNARSLRATEPLRVGLKDIKEMDKRGKWWLVGASWKGDGTNEQSVSSSSNPEPHAASAEDESETGVDGITAAADLLKLAKEQRMNTDVRRAVFITVMSASDHQDAYLRLMKLRLKRGQEPEISRVLLHCAGAEQNYNPYYTLISRKLCGEHRLKMAFQFGLWDLFKRMGEQGGDDDVEGGGSAGIDDDDESRQLGMRAIVNYAKLYGALIAEGGLSLGVLKKLNFTYLQAKTQTFLELLFITIFLRCEGQQIQQAVANILLQTRGNPTLARGLQIFLKKVVSKTDVAGGKAEKGIVRQGCRVADGVLFDAATASVEEPEE